MPTGRKVVLSWNVVAVVSCTILSMTAGDPGRAETTNSLRPSCAPEEALCAFELAVARHWTMMHRLPGRVAPVRIKPSGRAEYLHTAQGSCNSTLPLSQHKLKSVVTVDGLVRMVMLVNGQLPGPPIVVYHGQQVVVRVTNNLLQEALTIHFHGQHQRGTPWMDGGGGVSQCSILPGHTFTYRFVADPVGTHWYHDHEGIKRAAGIFGPLIVLPRPHDAMQSLFPKPTFRKEFIMTIHDWYKDTPSEMYHQVSDKIKVFDNDFKKFEDCFYSINNVDGFRNSMFRIRSILINGKGWHYPRNGEQAENPGIPIETFTVEKGGKYLFRVISSTMDQTLRVSVDAHPLHVVASDGYDVIAEKVESIIIGPAERYDFWIDASDPNDSGQYWIRVEGIEWTTTADANLNRTRSRPSHAEAELDYGSTRQGKPSTRQGKPSTRQGKPSTRQGKPSSTRQKCTELRKCSILNCPYRYYPTSSHMTCLPVTDLKSAHHVPQSGPSGPVSVEYFLHFRFADTASPKGLSRPTINGRKHVGPSAPPMTFPDQNWVTKDCSRAECQGTDLCECTHVLKLPAETTVQMVFFIQAHDGTPHAHPVHMHGHAFHVVKIGYPDYDPTTGLLLRQNRDIECLDNPLYCNEAQWADQRTGGDLPDVTSDTVRKDTIIIPVGGYVVVRIQTDNPGFWFLHCHVAHHNAGGMALILQEGETSDMPPPPDHFQTCGTFDWSDQEFRRKVDFHYGNSPKQPQLRHQNAAHVTSPDTSQNDVTKLKAALGVVSCLLVISLAVSAWIYCRTQKFQTRQGFRRIPTGDY